MDKLINDLDLGQLAEMLKVGEMGGMSWNVYEEKSIQAIKGPLITLLIMICSIEDPTDLTIERKLDAIHSGAEFILTRIGSLRSNPKCRRLAAWMELIDFFFKRIPPVEKLKIRKEFDTDELEALEDKEYIEELMKRIDEIGGDIDFGLLGSLGILFAYESDTNAIETRMNSILNVRPELREDVITAIKLFRKTKA